MSKKVKDTSLSQEEFEELLEDLADFDEQAFIAFAGTDQYEIIPTVTEDGKVLSRKEMFLLKRECERLGCTILYKIDKKGGETLLVNALTGKIMVLKDGMQ